MLDEKDAPITPDNQFIIINNEKYSYSVTKSEGKENSLLIKLFDPN